MHDCLYFEGEGTPAVVVASAEFRDAAEAQARALGMPDLARVFVPHPIQDRTDAEMHALADAACDAIIAALTLPQPDTSNEDRRNIDGPS